MRLSVFIIRNHKNIIVFLCTQLLQYTSNKNNRENGRKLEGVMMQKSSKICLVYLLIVSRICGSWWIWDQKILLQNPFVIFFSIFMVGTNILSPIFCHSLAMKTSKNILNKRERNSGRNNWNTILVIMVGVYHQSENKSVNDEAFWIKHILNSLAQDNQFYQDVTIMTRNVIQFVWSGR